MEDVSIDPIDDQQDTETFINVTPLVNLSLVLVLVFMVTSPFFVKDLIPVRVPEAVTSKTEDRENITISISPDYGYTVNEIPIKKPALEREMKRVMRKSGISYVLIRADERTPHGDIEDVMRIGKKLRVKRIAFATVPKI